MNEKGPGDFSLRRIPLHDLALPPSGEVHAWYLDLGRLAQSLQVALDGHERGASGASFTTGQLRFARRFYLRLLLGAYLGLPGKSVKINRSNRGKPSLDNSIHKEELHFSMAKSEDRLLIGFSMESHLGVDLEPATRRARNALGVANRYFSKSEAESLAAMPPASLEAAFLRAWACKEAVVKASGQGIANQLCRFTVETDLSRPVALLDIESGNAGDWALALLQPERDFLGAVAVRDDQVSIRAFSLLPAQGPARED
jgi:4'-phosphopantetheinyl transferase